MCAIIDKFQFNINIDQFRRSINHWITCNRDKQGLIEKPDIHGKFEEDHIPPPYFTHARDRKNAAVKGDDPPNSTSSELYIIVYRTILKLSYWCTCIHIKYYI